MDGHNERTSPKDAPSNTEMLFALLTQSEELRKGIVYPGHARCMGCCCCDKVGFPA